VDVNLLHRGEGFLFAREGIRFVFRSKLLAQQVIAICTLLALVIGWSPVAAQDQTAAIDRAVQYIRSQQQPDGSFAGFGPGSTADAIYALAAADVNVAEVREAGASPVEYVRGQVANVQDAGLAAKFVIALLLAGQNPITPEADYVAIVERSYNAETGQYGADVTAHAYSLIALTAAGRPVPPEAIEALKRLQLPDGGWSFDGTPATGSDTNTTSLAVQALKATGDQSDAIAKAVTYFRAQQNDDAGFPYSKSSSFGSGSDANSTALSIQALIAAGEDLQNWAKNGQTPTDRLLQFQNPSGAFRYQDTPPDDNAVATYQAVPALAGDTLPLEAIATIAAPAPVESAVPSVAPTVPPSPSAAPPAGGTPRALPNTGTADLVPAIPVVGALLLASGLMMRRVRG
jgi:hypothetical protein